MSQSLPNILKEKAGLFNFRAWLKRHWKAVLFLVLLVGLAYFNGLNADFTSDDTRSILNNKSLDKINYVFSQPKITLQSIIHFSVNKIFGHVPLYYRLANIFFHTAAVIAAFILFSILIGPKAAFFSAAILAVHPIEVESVTWISGGGYPQYAFFVMLALLFYVLSFKDRRLFKFSVIFFVISLMTADMAVTFPLILFAFMLSFVDLKKDWKGLIPFFTVLVIFVLLYVGRVGQRIDSFQVNFYQSRELLNPLIQIPIAITSYLGLIFWPAGLTLYHSEMVFSMAEYLARIGVFIIFLGVIAYSFTKSRRAFFGFSLFVISLLPTLTPLGITWVVAERYVYLGSIGIFLVVSLLLKRLSEIKGLKIPVNILFVLIIFALMARTIARNVDWRNEDNLWLATAKTSPSSPNTHNNLGDVYGRRGDAQKAIEEFRKAIEIKPNYADAYHNLANTYQEMGRAEEAIENYKKAIEFNPRLWQSYQNLGALYFQKGQMEQAEEYFKKVVEVNSADSNSYANLGFLYLVWGKKKEARGNFEEALRIEPANQRAREGLNLSNR